MTTAPAPSGPLPRGAAKRVPLPLGVEQIGDRLEGSGKERAVAAEDDLDALLAHAGSLPRARATPARGIQPGRRPADCPVMRVVGRRPASLARAACKRLRRADS